MCSCETRTQENHKQDIDTCVHVRPEHKKNHKQDIDACVHVKPEHKKTTKQDIDTCVRVKPEHRKTTNRTLMHVFMREPSETDYKGAVIQSEDLFNVVQLKWPTYKP